MPIAPDTRSRTVILTMAALLSVGLTSGCGQRIERAASQNSPISRELGQDEATSQLETAVDRSGSDPYLVVLGVAQDGGAPQAGTKDPLAWQPERQRRVVSLALVSPRSGRRYLFEATPDFRQQLATLDRLAPDARTPGLDGVFLTHAHMGHYTGLMFLGFESIGATGTAVYAMPRMARYLETNGPWSQLVDRRNIELRELADGVPVALEAGVAVTPFSVPHRQEYSETVGFRIDGPHRSVLFLPDINSWQEWADQGVQIEQLLEQVDVAYLDGAFWDHGEIPGRDMSQFPHPMMVETMDRFASLPPELRARVRFLHLNYTNPALDPDSEQAAEVKRRGFRVAEELETVPM